MAARLRQAQAANLYSDRQSAVDASRSARDLFQLISLPLRVAKSVFTNLTFLAERGAFRLFFRWLSSTAGYVPGNEARLSSSDLLPTSGSSSYGCYPFLSGRSGKPFGLPWQAFRPQRRASLATSNRSAVALSQSLTTPFADPFAGLKDRNLRDGESYIEKNFSRQSFVCFIFFWIAFRGNSWPRPSNSLAELLCYNAAKAVPAKGKIAFSQIARTLQTSVFQN